MAFLMMRSGDVTMKVGGHESVCGECWKTGIGKRLQRATPDLVWLRAV